MSDELGDLIISIALVLAVGFIALVLVTTFVTWLAWSTVRSLDERARRREVTS